MSHQETKHGRLEMGFERGADGTTRLGHLFRKVPLVVQGALYFDEQLPQMPCVYILSSGGPIVEGDLLTERVTLGPSAMAHISTGAATIVASMEGGKAERYQQITLHTGGYLEWLPLPLIPGKGSRYYSSAEIIAPNDAALFWSEQVACGRLHYGERFAYEELDIATTVRRPNGDVILRDRLIIRPAERAPQEWALLGENNHFASVIMLAPSGAIDTLYDTLRPRWGQDMSISTARLKESAGIVVRLRGESSELLQHTTRELCSRFRQEVQGVPLAEEFPWRRGAISHKQHTL